MPDPQDVTADPSPASPDPTPAPEPEPSPVSDVLPGRTVDNLAGEMNRKYGELKSSIEQLAAIMLAAQSQPQQQQPQPAAPRGGTDWNQYTDQQLAQLAQSGSTDAQVALTERISARQVQEATTVNRQQDLVTRQLTAVYSRYPQLQDANHPLTQAALRTKSVLVANGHNPQARETDLEAIKLAIVDFPQFAVSAAPPAPAPVPGRRVDPTPQQQIDGATPRRTQPKPGGPAVKITPRMAEIAKRMGVDPEAAMKRFQERQDKGQSSVSPLVATIVREQS